MCMEYIQKVCGTREAEGILAVCWIKQKFCRFNGGCRFPCSCWLATKLVFYAQKVLQEPIGQLGARFSAHVFHWSFWIFSFLGRLQHWLQFLGKVSSGSYTHAKQGMLHRLQKFLCQTIVHEIWKVWMVQLHVIIYLILLHCKIGCNYCLGGAAYSPSSESGNI